MSMLYLCRRIQNSTAKSGGASAKNKLSALDLHRLCHQSKIKRDFITFFAAPKGYKISP